MSRKRNMFAELEFLGFDPLCIREALRTCNDFDSALNLLNSNKIIKLESELYNQGIPKSMAKFLAGTCQSPEEALKKYQEYVPVSQNIRRKCLEMGYPELLAEKAIDTMMPFDQAVQYIVTTDLSAISLSVSRTISSQRFQNLIQAQPPGPQMPNPQPYTSPPMMNQMLPPQYSTGPMQFPQPPHYPYNPPLMNHNNHPLTSGSPMPYSANQFSQNIMQGPHPMHNPQIPLPYNPPNFPQMPYLNNPPNIPQMPYLNNPHTIPQHLQPPPHPIANRLPNPPNIPIPSNVPYINNPHQHLGPMQPPFMSPSFNPPHPSPPLPQDIPYRVNRDSVSIRLSNNNPNDELLFHRDDIGRNFEEAFENMTISRSQRTLNARRMSIARPENPEEDDQQRGNQLALIRLEDFLDNPFGILLLLDILSRLYEPQGLNPEALGNLQKIQYSRNLNLNSETCVICYEDYEEGIEIIILKCKHPFHTECISKWLENSTKCPLCKCDLAEEE